MRIITKGATDQSLYFEVLDSSATDGSRLTGLVYNTASLKAYYVRNGGSPTSISLATLAAANSAHSDGGFKEVDATNMPGVYRLDLPDAAVATGADSVVVTIGGAANMAQVSHMIQLLAVNLQDAVRGGLTALPNAAADAAGGLPISDAGGLDLDAQIGTKINDILTDTAVIGAAGAGLSAVPWNAAWDAEVQSECADALTAYDPPTNTEMEARTLVAAGYATATALATVDSVADAIKAVTDNLPNSGALTSLATATALATVDGVVDDIKAKTDNLPSDPADQSLIIAATDAITSAIATVDTNVDGVKAVTDNLPDSGALSSLATAADLATVDGIVDTILVTTGKLDDTLENDGGTYRFTANALEEGPSGGGGGDAPTAEEVAEAVREELATELAHLDADVSSRASQTSVDTVDGVVDAVKAKTDNLPASPAAVGSAMTLTSGERTAIANEVEAQIIDDTDSEKVLTAITDKIAAVNPDLSGLTLSAIASAVRTELSDELGQIGDIDGKVDDILEDTGTTIPAVLGTPTELDDGATLADNLADIYNRAGTIGNNVNDLITDLSNVKDVTDKLDTTLEEQGEDTWGFTELALQEAPSGGGGGEGEADWTATEKAQIRYRLGIDGSTNTPSAALHLGEVDANVTKISGDATAADNLEAYCDGSTPQPVNVTHFGGTAGTFASGRPSTDVNAIANNAITAAVIATGAIDADALAGDCITNAKIADNAIGAENIAADAITAAKIADGAIDAGAIASNAITAAKIASDAITSAKIADGALDAVWGVSARTLTAGTNIVLAKGTGITGLNDLDAAGVRGAVGLASANLDEQIDLLPTNSELGVALIGLEVIDDVVDAIKEKTDLIPASPAASGDIPSANTIADAMLDRVNAIETGITVRGSLRAMLASVAGKATGLNTSAPTFKNPAGTKDRINATTDSAGNRSEITLDLT